jgi:hypothetical protein
MLACHRCPHRGALPPAGSAGLVLCTIDGKPFLRHSGVNGDGCPVGYFGKIEGMGDVLGRVIFWLRAGYVTRWWKRVTGWGCGCSTRRTWLNRAVPLGWLYALRRRRITP